MTLRIGINGFGRIGRLEFRAAGENFASDPEVVAINHLLEGGGDTVAAIAKFGVERDLDDFSTGGGAFLEMLGDKIFAALDVLQRGAKGAPR